MATLTPGEPHRWYTEGPLNNPADTDALADTGEVDAIGDFLAEVVISADAACVLNIELYQGVTVLKTQRLYYGGSARDTVSIPFRANATDYAVRVIPNAAVTGNVSASIFLQKLT